MPTTNAAKRTPRKTVRLVLHITQRLAEDLQEEAATLGRPLEVYLYLILRNRHTGLRVKVPRASKRGRVPLRAAGKRGM